MIALLLILTAAPQWEPGDTVDGISMASRALPDERLVELKLTAMSKASVVKLCEAAFGPKVLDPKEPDITLRRVIRAGEGELITYEQISPPIVSNRDYVVRATKQQLPNGACRVTFAAANELAPPLPDGFVRISKLHGSWDFEPVGEQTRITYVIFADPGGAIPAVLIEGPRRKTAVAWMKLILERATHER